jgi:pimeloyl-ACP methyl ester carboxylesterase
MRIAVMTFVLVPGAWLGAWCWSDVVELLAAAGQDAIALSLAGLGERAHLLTPEVGLETHVTEVVALLNERNLLNVVLVGHSYGGTVITAAAEVVPQRIEWLVYLDGSVPQDGESNDNVVGREMASRLHQDALRAGDDWRLPPPSVSDWELPADVRELVQTQLRPHPLRSLTEPVRLRSPVAAALKRAYLRSSQRSALYGSLMDRARKAGWWCEDLCGGHYAMLTAPRAVAAALLQLAHATNASKGGYDADRR